MKLIISRKVIFKGDKEGKADSIINQYALDGNVEDIHFIMLSLLDVLRHEFTQEKQKKKIVEHRGN